MSATHTVTVDCDDDGTAWGWTFHCSGDDSSECHQWCAEGCEESCYGPAILPADTELIAQAPIAGHRWAPMRPACCRIVDWLDAVGGDDSFVGENYDQKHQAGTHVIDEEWTGDDYVWSYAEVLVAAGKP